MQNGQRDQERTLYDGLGSAEYRVDSFPALLRQTRARTKKGQKQRLQCCKRQIDLRLHGGSRQHFEAPGGGVVADSAK